MVLKINKKSDGNTLLEVLFAAILLSIGVLALMFSINTSTELVTVSREASLALRMADMALETLKSDQEFDKLYQKYKNYDDSNVSHRFYILPDKSLDWSLPDKVPVLALGEGYCQFVTNENAYSPEEWGTETAFYTNGKLYPGQIDLDGDRKIGSQTIVIGRTSGTPTSQKSGYYIVLPVKIAVRIYSQSRQNFVLGERKAWLFNNIK